MIAARQPLFKFDRQYLSPCSTLLYPSIATLRHGEEGMQYMSSITITSELYRPFGNLQSQSEKTSQV